MPRSITITLSFLLLAAAPVAAQTHASQPTDADPSAQLPEVGRVAADELARVAVPILDDVVAEPIPMDWDFILLDTSRARLAERTLTVRHLLIEQDDGGHHLLPR